MTIEDNIHVDKDDDVVYVAPEPIENTMNDGDPSRLLKYLDPEFLDAIPDKLAKPGTQFLDEQKEKLEVDEEEVDLPALEEGPKMMDPREYQYELFQKAVEENVIAVLDTGSGKTLIAVMLIKHIAAKEREERLQRRKAKLSFFLVDRVPLVFQQASVIKANCDVVLEHMCGDMGVDTWSEKKWRLIFEESDVCVMTAQILLDTLRHGFISMDCINLIVFDEAHHARKNHPYNLIMREFYDRCPHGDRPKIFGMTASPMNSKTGVEYSAGQLERNLDCKIYTATVSMADLNAVVIRPREFVLPFAASPGYEQTKIGRAISEKLRGIERMQRSFQVTEHMLQHLGPWCCDRLWRHLLDEMEGRLQMATKGRNQEELLLDDQALSEACEVARSAAPDNPDFLDTKLFTPKVIMLLRSLKIYAEKHEKFCGIIFVERRHTAIVLSMLIKTCEALKNIKPGTLIGHGSTDEGDVQMLFREQNRTIKAFRDGAINLLIATNVAEEGLDIQPCNVVIRFDPFTTLIGYIQSRGRARQKDSTYIVLMDESDIKRRNLLSEFKDLEEDMKEYCRSLPAERNLAKRHAVNFLDETTSGSYDSDEEDDDYCEKIYVVLKTNATITKQSAVPLIHRYCNSLPSDSFCVLQPTFEITQSAEGFQCILRLPSNAAIPEVTSEAAKSKTQAKYLAALEACIQLHKLGSFNDHLLPNNPRREMLGEMEPQYDENGMIIGSRRRRGIYEKRTPRFWEKVEETEEELEKEETQTETADPTVSMENEQIGNSLPSGLTKETAIVNGVRHEPLIGTEAGIKDSLEDIGQVEGTEAIQFQKSSTKAQQKGLDPVSLMDEAESIPANNTTTDWENGPFHVWMTTIEIDLHDIDYAPIRRLSFFTWKQFPMVPQFNLYNRGVPFQVRVQSLPYSFEFDKETINLLAAFNLKLFSTITNKNFSCSLIDYPYFLVPMKTYNSAPSAMLDSNEACLAAIDWDEMQRATENDLVPLDMDALDLDDVILIDHADNSRRYFVRELCHELHPNSPIPPDMKIRETGYESFAAYYYEKYELQVTNPNQPMARVHKVNKVMNYLQPLSNMTAKEKESTASFLIPEFCRAFSVKASVLQSARLIPSIMTRIDSFLLVQEAKVRYDIPVDDTYMLEAYTTPSASMENNYERLETLGDSLLKFIATIRLYINFPFSNEGELHCLRIRVICNRALYRAAKRLKLYRYVTSHAFNRRYWRPHHFVANTDTEDTLKETKTHMLSDKTLADIVEASLGAAYLSSGLEGGLKCAIEMQIPFDEIQQWSDFLPAYLASKDKVPPRAEIQALRSISARRIQEITGYEFKRPLLIVEALTHASLPNSTAPCYQRLEFLGDAILDFLVIRYLFAKYPEGDPGLITDLKDSCVNNHVLGIICIEASLHTQIIHYSSRLVRAIEAFVCEVEDMKDKNEAVGEYWTDLSVPKVLSDVVESMLGAVFVDAGFDLEPVEAVFKKWIQPILDAHVTPELIKIHPLRKFTTDLQRFGCESFMLRNHTTSGTGPESQKCVIFLHDKPLACGAADNVKAARRVAAAKANLRLEEEPGLLEQICNCSIRAKKRALEEEDE
ncbi:Dicer-like protein 1 [Apophysomyces ossiformis]|uniref:Dicer-like protein 1 n=1 Tax=Apophysomyces ossiformis TaxID=679940 RepID=A0A8H7BNL8_9FUNG|nr:Dicer-like protein 1 [Apophysomyces ossiformis]